MEIASLLLKIIHLLFGLVKEIVAVNHLLFTEIDFYFILFNYFIFQILNRGIDAVMALVRGANGLFHAMEPWKLNKQGEIEQLNAVMGATMECSRIVGILLQPIIPSFTDRLLSKCD